jgi:2-dehydropantoate 2-reductase
MRAMRIAVVGPGAIGTGVAAALERDGARELVLCARTAPPDGLVVVDPDGAEQRLRSPVVTDPEAVDGAVDWVLLAVKAHQTGGAEPWLRRLCAAGTVVAALQNGVEQRATIAPLAGGAPVVPVVVWLPAEGVAPGRIQLRGPVSLTVADDEEGCAFAALFDGSDAEVALAEGFPTVAWHKLLANAVAGLMPLAGRRSGMFRHDDVAAVARALALEGLAVARAEGAQLGDEVAEEILGIIAAYPEDLGSSILFDRLAGRRLEWDARNGVIQRLGARHGIPTPVSDVLVPLLAAASGERGG